MPAKVRRGPTKFSAYNAEELRRCGKELLAFVRGQPEMGAALWTEFVLDWFAATAAPGLLVDAKARQDQRGNWRKRWGVGADVVPARQTQGEFMLDLVHSTYPPYNGEYWTPEYFERALAGPCQVRLALESEWGDARSGDVTVAAVMHDAFKLPAVRANVKVMLFGTRKASGGPKLFDMLTTLRTRAGDTAPWLVLNLPWDGATTGDAATQMRIL